MRYSLDMSQHELLRSHVRSVYAYQQPNKDHGENDIFLELMDGRIYSFLAATPQFMAAYMARENSREFVSPGLLVVDSLEAESILNALEACVRTSQQGLPLDHYGVLQEALGAGAGIE